MRIALNGFGRIGKTFVRTVLLDARARSNIDIVAINIGPGNPQRVAHDFAYDTLMGPYPGNVVMDDATLCIDGSRIAVMAESDPQNLAWDAYDVDWVVEASGRFTTREAALLHINAARARHVLITAPANGDDVTIIPGINDTAFDAHHHRIVALGSCTSNAVIPLLKVVDDAFGIVGSLMTTVHAYTNSQVLLDVLSSDPRRSRAAALNIVPATTGVVSVVDKVLPGMGSRFDGISLRVPVAKVSIVDLVFTAHKNFTRESINEALESASQGDLNGIMAFNRQPLVSSDFNNDPHSVTIDSLLTLANARMGKVFGWYDNEWGYCQRIKDFLLRNS